MAQIIPVSSSFQRSAAKLKKYRETVVVVHHYGGNRHSFDRHVDWLNELGFDVVTFDLPSRNLVTLSRIPIGRDWGFGLRHVWADKIEDVLGSLSEDKFILSFSFPSVAVAMALARRHAIDVRGWITEGGPFKRVIEGIENLFRTEVWHNVIADEYSGNVDLRRWRIFKWSVDRFEAAKNFAADATALMFGTPNYDYDADRALKQLPKNFPVLSLRGEKEELVNASMIDEFFAAGANSLELKKVLLPHSGHLQGFALDTDLYKDVVATFLADRATPV